MKSIGFVAYAIVNICFFALIGLAVWLLGSSGPLWALFLTPILWSTYSEVRGKEVKKKK